MALLDGQQRLTSLMILARVLYERAMRSKTDVLRSYGANIAWIMGRDLVWKRAFLYQEPATLRHIRQIYFALDREYRQLEADAALDDAQNAGALSFYEETLLRDLRRFRYILLSGRLAVNVLRASRKPNNTFRAKTTADCRCLSSTSSRLITCGLKRLRIVKGNSAHLECFQ